MKTSNQSELEQNIHESNGNSPTFGFWINIYPDCNDYEK